LPWLFTPDFFTPFFAARRRGRNRCAEGDFGNIADRVIFYPVTHSHANASRIATQKRPIDGVAVPECHCVGKSQARQ
jgi:hypothetical protein